MRRILLLSLVIISLLLSACIQSPPRETSPAQMQTAESTTSPSKPILPPSQPNENAPKLCASAKNVLEKDSCYLKEAQSSRDVKLCYNIYSASPRDECLSLFMQNDHTLCEKLTSPTLKQDCYYAAALRLNETNYCVQISNEDKKYECLKVLSPPCSFEKDTEAKNLCLALLKSDVAYCMSNECRLKFATATKTLAPCGLIEGEKALQLACNAVVKNDAYECQAANISTLADFCYLIAARELNSSAWCNFGKAGSTYRNTCYTEFAISASDPAACGSAAPETARDECYLDYSVKLDKPAACQNVLNSLIRSKCQIQTARTNADMAACNDMLYNDRKSCYNLVLTGDKPIKSAESCKAVTDDAWAYKCLMAFAQQNQDKSVCAYIKDEALQASCAAKFN